MIVKFTVPGECVGKGRPKFKRVGEYTHTYTPKKTVEYENLIKLEYERQCGGVYFDGEAPLAMVVDCYMSIPKSVSKKRYVLMKEQKLRPLRKPDVDNTLKCFGDALNGIAYKDDSHIVEAWIRKFYSDRPRCEVMITDEILKDENGGAEG